MSDINKEFDSLEESGELDELYRQAEERYARLKAAMDGDPEYKAAVLAHYARGGICARRLAERMYGSHREDGNLFPAILGAVVAESLTMNIAGIIAEKGPGDAMYALTALTLPYFGKLYEDLQRAEIEEMLSEQ
jgi:hypothetical protein